MGCRILLVEDNESVRQIFITIVEHLGYACSHAWDGREGVDTALTSRPDIIFMDLMMPRMDGVDAIRQIKALPFIAHIPIIVFTSALADPRIAEATAAGADEVLIKPVSIAQIDGALRKHLNRLGLVYINRGLDSHKQADLAGALASYDEAVRVSPAEPTAFNNRGSARRDAGDLEGAIADYNEAIRLRPDYAMAFNNRGVTRADLGDLDGAITDYTEAIRLRPNDAVAYNNRGTARHDKGDIDGALADYGEALRVKSDYPEALRNQRSTSQRNRF